MGCFVQWNTLLQYVFCEFVAARYLRMQIHAAATGSTQDCTVGKEGRGFLCMQGFRMFPTCDG